MTIFFNFNYFNKYTFRSFDLKKKMMNLELGKKIDNFEFLSYTPNYQIKLLGSENNPILEKG